MRAGRARATMAAACANSSAVSAEMLAMSGHPEGASRRAASRSSPTSSSAPGLGSPMALIRPWPQSMAVGFRWPRRGAGVQVFAVTAPAPRRAARSSRVGEVPQMPEARTSGVGQPDPGDQAGKVSGSPRPRAHPCVPSR